MENNKTIIKFLRSSKPENSLDDAVKKLNLLENKHGQPILVLYYTETGLIDCLHAIGVKDGIGPETYSIISSNSSLLVSKVGLEENDIPDVTEPLYDQVFIYRNNNTDQTFWVIDKKGKRELIEIEKKTDKKETEPYLIVKETISGSYWWINGYEVKKAFDFNTRAEFKKVQDLANDTRDIVNVHTQKLEVIEDKLDLIDEALFPLELNIKLRGEQKYLNKKGNPVNLILDVSVFKGKNSVINQCSFTLLKTRNNIVLDEIRVDTIVEDDFGYFIDAGICSENTEVTVFAIWNEDHKFKDEKTIKLVFVEPSFYGKITINNSHEFQSTPWLIGQTFSSLLKTNSWDDFIIFNWINNKLNNNTLTLIDNQEISIELSDIILKQEKENYEFSLKTTCSDYVFFLEPEEFIGVNEIIDEALGEVTGNFLKFKGSLRIDGNTVKYNMYIKDMPTTSQSNLKIQLTY